MVANSESEIERLRAGIIPRHVAVIMDGNGRWAKLRHRPRLEGHRAGGKSVRRAIEASKLLGVRYLTLYTFSLENWQRPPAEVGELMRLLKYHLSSEQESLIKEGVRLRLIGFRRLLPQDVNRALSRVEEMTSGGRNLDLILAISYGSRQEMAAAAEALAGEVKAGKLPPEAIDAVLFNSRLFTADDIPPVDLLIRTSGENRVSNFLLWQSAGACFHLTPVLWPDFSVEAYAEAVRDYQTRLVEDRAAS